MLLTLTGTVYGSLDSDGQVFGNGAGYDTLNGRAVVQQFRWDSAAPVFDNNGGSDPASAYYLAPFSPASLSCSWITVTTVVDGVPLVEPIETPGPTAFANCDSLSVTDKYDPADGWTWLDAIDLVQVGRNVTPGDSGTLYTSTQSRASIQKFADFLDGIGLMQQFNLVIADEYFAGGGRVERGEVLVAPDGSTQLWQRSGYFDYTIQTATLAVVPLPGAVFLFGAAVASLLPLRRRQA